MDFDQVETDLVQHLREPDCPFEGLVLAEREVAGDEQVDPLVLLEFLDLNGLQGLLTAQQVGQVFLRQL
eukprot:CAMPEP_0170497814 /NCGR_PEP_ID=MMETSP0208-20121228/25878_1 /TAXON_ID=197538 /ORGANISM="Strombidium inclinatum, Strain S3" /LENGTH=68 /DNA_ID=CAMNT_0010774755 /DNA_START=2982 /DNA_END=3188 /DNA_ORIENTATION=-